MIHYLYTCEGCGLEKKVLVDGRMNVYRTIENEGWEIRFDDNDRLYCPTCKLSLGAILRDSFKHLL